MSCSHTQSILSPSRLFDSFAEVPHACALVGQMVKHWGCVLSAQLTDDLFLSESETGSSVSVNMNVLLAQEQNKQI